MTQKRSATWPLYPRFIAALITGGTIALRTDGKVGKLKGWDDAAIDAVISIASGQLESQRAALDRMISRAQFLFTTLLGLLTLVFSATPSIWASKTPFYDELVPRVLLALSIGLLVIALLGTAALIAVKKEFDAISASVLSRWKSFDRTRLAVEYAKCIDVGEQTNNAHLTAFGTSVRLTLYGVIALASAWAAGVFL
ncbi:hypothetical protein [Schumannella luteola]